MNRVSRIRSPGAKRLMVEAQELRESTEDYWAQPLEDNLFEWHFTVRGPPDSVFQGGYYHGKLSFPNDYPMKPPSIKFLTPNGRFETDRKICLSISGYHPESWQPSWSVRTALVALIAFMPTKAHHAIGSLDYSDEERRKLAAKSKEWRCQTCGRIRDHLVDPTDQKKGCAISEPGPSGADQSLPDHSSQNNSKPSDSVSDVVNDKSEKTEPENDNLYSTNKKPENSEPTNSIDSLEVDRDNVSHATHEESQPGADIRTEQRRSTSPLVLKSIIAILFLLILRRIVMFMS